MAKQYEILDRHGRVVEDDVIPDGGRLRVSMMMKDGMSEVQRAVAEDAEARRFPVVDAFGRPAGQRPGACYLRTAPHTTDHAKQVMADHMRREARDQHVADLQDGWKNGTSDREIARRIHNTGDARTDAYLDQKYDLENSWHRGTGKR
jgi:hypothetical protein